MFPQRKLNIAGKQALGGKEEWKIFIKKYKITKRSKKRISK